MAVEVSHLTDCFTKQYADASQVSLAK